MTTNDEISEQAAAIAWWLAPENAQAMQELRERNEALSMWLDMVQKKVEERLAQVEREAMKV